MPGVGCGEWNNYKHIKSLPGNIDMTMTGILTLTGRTYYTAFAITYPEGSYGGDAAGRQGLTAGYNVRSGTPTYYSTRGLHLWVWNHDAAACNCLNALRGRYGL